MLHRGAGRDQYVSRGTLLLMLLSMGTENPAVILRVGCYGGSSQVAVFRARFPDNLAECSVLTPTNQRQIQVES